MTLSLAYRIIIFVAKTNALLLFSWAIPLRLHVLAFLVSFLKSCDTGENASEEASHKRG